jgi:hypothetical protein
MKHVIVALFAGSLALSSLSAIAADAGTADQPKAETRTEKAKDYVKEKAHNAKVKTKKAGKKVKKTIKERKTTDPASPNESKPDTPPSK